jgi:hypothetical protein
MEAQAFVFHVLCADVNWTIFKFDGWPRHEMVHESPMLIIQCRFPHTHRERYLRYKSFTI